MENILSAILSQLDDNSLQAIGKQTNASPAQAKNALADAIPVIMNALARNSSTKEGAAALQNAIERDHDGSLLDNLGGFLNNPQSANGAGILKHVLGNKRQNVEQYISKDTGLSGAATAKILEMAAPLVMGFLGKQKKASGSSDIGSILNAALNAGNKQSNVSQGIISQLLDRDNDGNVADDIANMGMSFISKMMKKRR